jgi:hypothetical protein
LFEYRIRHICDLVPALQEVSSGQLDCGVRSRIFP